MKLTHVLLSLATLSILASAQVPDTLWTRYHNWTDNNFVGSTIWDIELDDEGFVAGGWIVVSSSPWPRGLVRFTSEGDSVWTASHSVREFDRVNDELLVAAGWPSLITCTMDGDTTTLYDEGESGYATCVTSDSAFAVMCAWEYAGPPLLIAKVSFEGDTFWTYRQSEDHVPGGGGIAPTTDGGVIVLYVEYLGWFTRQVCVLRLGPDGDSLWTVTYAPDIVAGNSDIFRTPDGNYLHSAGWSDRMGHYEVRIMKLSETGEHVFLRSYPISGEMTHMSMTQDGGAVVSTRFFNESTVLRVDRDGDSLWTTFVPSPAGLELFYVSAVEPDTMGGYLFAACASITFADCSRVVVGQLDLEPPALCYSVIALEDTFSLAVTCSTYWEFRSAALEFWRATSPDEEFVLADSQPAAGDASDGAAYTYLDTDVTPGTTYWYFPAVTNPQGRRWEFRDHMISATPLEVNHKSIDIPREFSLCLSPNPFNSQATLTLSVPMRGFVQVTVFDLLGREARTYGNKLYPPGQHHLIISGDGLSSGLYFVVARSEHQFTSQKLMLLK